MSQSDTRQRYANKNANQSRPSRPNWGSEAREFRPVGQRYGSVLVLSGPKRKQATPAVRKPIPRPVNLPSQRKDRHAEGSLLGSKQGRPEDSQQVESTTHSLNSQSWQNSNTGTWSAPQEASSRTDEYGFPIRSEAPINAREFPTLAASKQSGPPSKQRPQHEQVQADAYFSLDDRDTLPSELKATEDRGFGTQREDHRATSREDWRNGTGRPGLGGADRAPVSGDGGRDVRGFRDEVDSRLFSSNRPQSDSRRGAFGFHTQEQDRSRSGLRPGHRLSDSGGGFGPSAARDGRSGPRMEEYGLLAGEPSARSGSKPQEDYMGPATHGAVDVFSSTLLAAGVAPPASTGASLGAAMKTAAVDPSDSEEDEELVAHYMELELIKAEEEEKDRQRALAAEAAGQEGSGDASGDEEGEGEGDTWEDAAEKDDGADGDAAGDAAGLKPVDPTKWQQRQAEIEAEDRLRRERAEAKKRALEEAIARREEDKTRAAREASEAALAALVAADQPLPPAAAQVVVPPPPPPPRTTAPAAGTVPVQFPVQPPPPPPATVMPGTDEPAAGSVSRSTEQPSSTMESLPTSAEAAAAASAATSAVAASHQHRRPDFVPAPAPAKPAWGQALYSRADNSQQPAADSAPGASAGAAGGPAPLMRNSTDSRQDTAPQQEGWSSHEAESSSYWRDGSLLGQHRQRGFAQAPANEGSSGGRLRDIHGQRDEAHQGRGRGRRARGDGRSNGRGRHHVSDLPPPASSAAPIHSSASSVVASGTPPPGAPSASASSTAASDADAAAVAAAAKAAKAMENITLPTLVSPVSRKSPVDILPPSVSNAQSTSHSSSAPQAQHQDVMSSVAVSSPLQREGSLVATPQPQHSAPAVYDTHYSAGPDLGLPSSNSVPALDTDEKHAGMFDGADMGENLLPSNILGLDDTPYPASKPAHSDPVSSGNAQILPMHDPSFSSPLDQNKTLSPIAHARPFTCSDHGSHLGAPLSSSSTFPGHSQPPPPAHNVRDRLSDQAHLWGLPGHEWEARTQQQQPPLHPPSGDLHLHTGGFGSVPVASPGAYSSPSKPQQHNSGPGTVPVGVSSAQPVFHNTFGYPSGTVFSMQSFAPTTQMHVPLVPTSKPPDWSNNGSSALGWNAMHPHAVPQSRPMSVLAPPGNMPKSQESGSFQMQDPQATHSAYQAGGVPMNQMTGSGGHQHPQQHCMRLSEVEMNLPDNLGLGGSSAAMSHISMAPPQNAQHMSQPSNMHVRSGGGGNRSSNRSSRNGGGLSSHSSAAPHSLGGRNSNSQSGGRGGAGGPDGHPANSSNNSGGGRGDGGHRRHGGHGANESERSNNSSRRHGGRSRGGHGRNHGRRGRGGHANDNTAAASLVSVE